MFSYHYSKFTTLLVVVLLIFTTPLSSDAQEQSASPLLSLLEGVPQEAAFPQMDALTLSYADYRAIEQANAAPTFADRAAYLTATEADQTLWQMSLLRVHAGPSGFVNLTYDKITQMPELIGFDYFDMDQALVFGSDPYVGTLVHNDERPFSPVVTGFALAQRGYERREAATGEAWGLGGDGMTDINNINNGDPFGGDVGLASRVAVLDANTVANSFLWGIVLSSADAHTQQAPAYAAHPAYTVLTDALSYGDGTLLQAVALSRLAGEDQQTDAAPSALPAYTIAAVADLQDGDQQVQRVVLVYASLPQASAAALQLPGRMAAFDSGWLDTLGFTERRPYITTDGDFFVVTVDLVAARPTATDMLDGAYAPATIFGFWVTAIQQGGFFPLALEPTATDVVAP